MRTDDKTDGTAANAKFDSKFDAKKHLPHLYAPKNLEFERVIVPPLNYLAIDGYGDPDDSDYATAMGAIYAVAYPLKFSSKKMLGRDYAVPPAEALWWADDPSSFVTGNRGAWKWTILSMIPSWIDESMVASARQKAVTKGASASARVMFRTLTEGDSFQLLHIGPYSEEAPKLERLHNVIMPEAGMAFAGAHHEIYLSDPRRTAPDKLKTILRQPVTAI